MKTPIYTLIALLGAASLAAQMGIAGAQTAPQNAAAPAPKHEHGEHMRARWQQADLDKDNQLSKAEAQAAGMKHMSDKFDAIDANKDGKVSEAEVKMWMQSSSAEKHAGKPASKTMLPAQGAAVNTPANPPQGGAMDYKTPEQRQTAAKERFARADTNKDGALSKTEVQAADMKRLADSFDVIDTNKDGKITQEELRAVWERRKQ